MTVASLVSAPLFTIIIQVPVIHHFPTAVCCFDIKSFIFRILINSTVFILENFRFSHHGFLSKPLHHSTDWCGGGGVSLQLSYDRGGIITGHSHSASRWKTRVGGRRGQRERRFGLGTLVTLYVYIYVYRYVFILPHESTWCSATGESEMGTTFAGKYPLDDAAAAADATGVLPESTPPPGVICFFSSLSIFPSPSLLRIFLYTCLAYDRVRNGYYSRFITFFSPSLCYNLENPTVK